MGQLYIIAAPSGAGKTSLVKALVNKDRQIILSVSYTTRKCRAGEVDSQDYHFVTEEVFKQMINRSAFIEFAQVFDHWYGTSQQWLDDKLAQEYDVILEIDWQGARQIRELRPESLSIFILPPSIAILEQRLNLRGKDDPETIKRRMADAVNEMSHYAEFDYLVVNDDFETALTNLHAIFLTQRLQLKNQQRTNAHLLNRLLE